MSGFKDIASGFDFNIADADAPIRAAAFAEIDRLTRQHGNLAWKHIAKGFLYNNQTVLFSSRPRGIFKPRQMNRILSIKTVYPRAGRSAWYADQGGANQQIYREDDSVDYSFAGTDADARDNRLLRDAMDLQIPLIYFLGTAPEMYQAIVPTFVIGFDPKALKARLAFAPSEVATRAPETVAERRYALRAVKQRLHQGTFRQMVIDAYNGRCAISGLPEPLLLDAAHIAEDKDERFGQPIIVNGLPLSKIHHAAFDAHLIGVDADRKIHVSGKLLSLNDGPQLEALRQFHGKTLLPPSRDSDRPDRERLARRFEIFRKAA